MFTTFIYVRAAADPDELISYLSFCPRCRVGVAARFFHADLTSRNRLRGDTVNFVIDDLLLDPHAIGAVQPQSATRRSQWEPRQEFGS